MSVLTENSRTNRDRNYIGRSGMTNLTRNQIGVGGGGVGVVSFRGLAACPSCPSWTCPCRPCSGRNEATFKFRPRVCQYFALEIQGSYVRTVHGMRAYQGKVSGQLGSSRVAALQGLLYSILLPKQDALRFHVGVGGVWYMNTDRGFARKLSRQRSVLHGLLFWEI